MPKCLKCENIFPNRIKVEGKIHNVQRRKYCLICSPFGKHNNRQLHLETEGDSQIRRRKSWVKYSTNRRRELKKELIKYKGGKCQVCGYSRCIDALECHHQDSSKKDFSISAKGYTRSWAKVKEELDKCMLLCANCHREIHAQNAASTGNRG